MSVHRHRRQPVLAPGTRAVRRGRGSWQVGIDPGRRVVVPAGAEVDAEIDALRRGAIVPGEETPLLRSLDRAGLIRATPGTPPRILVRGSLGPETMPVPGATDDEDDPTALGLLLSLGEPPREQLDPWVRESRAHIVVRVLDGRLVVGPLVVPGVTACLRCLDAHLIDVEPDHYAVLHRYIHTAREDSHGDAIPASTAHLGLSWALHELESHAAAHTPMTLSSTLVVDASGIECTTWHRHPECGCAWSGTIAP